MPLLAPFLPALPMLGVRRHAPAGLTARDLIAALGARARAVILVIDDAPLLDDTSAAVAYQLVRAFAVPTIMTARTEHELSGPLARLAVENAVHTLEVGGLTRAETDDLLRRHFDTTARPDDVSRLHEQTGGNPLYLREVVTLAERRGLIRHVDPGVEIGAVDLPRGVHSSIGDRLVGLDPESLAVLRLVTFGASAPRSALIRPEEDRHVDELVARGLVDLRPGNVLSPSHPSVGEVVREGLSAQERERFTCVVADRLGASADDDLRFTAVRLRCDSAAGPAIPDLEWAVRRAFAIGEHAIAHDLSGRLRRDLGASPPPFGVLIDDASALSALGRLDDADTAFDAARAAATTSAERALLVSRCGTHLAYRRFDVPGALALAEAASGELTARDRALLEPEIRTWRILTGQIASHGSPPDQEDGGTNDTATAADISPEVALRGAISAVMLDSMSGRVTGEAADVLARIEREQGILDPSASAMVHLQRYFMLLSLGQGDAAAAVCEEQRVVSTPDAAGMWSLTLGIHRMYNGRLTEALDLAELAAEQLRWRDPLGFLGFALALRANVEAQRGEAEAARSLLDDLLPAQLGDPKTALQVLEARAYLAVHAGDAETASRLAVGACRGASEAGHDLVAAISLAVCVRVGRASDAMPLLQEIQNRVGPELGLYAALRDVALALTERRPALVRDAARRLATAGMNAAAIDALHQAERWPATRGDEAELLAHRRLRRSLQQAGDAPSRWTEPDEAVPLTAREQEIVDLVRQRLSSPEIATRLVVSVRTVDNHLAKVYRKLGVSSRAEVRALLGP